MSLTHAELESDLVQARVGLGASDLHGSVTGYLCGGGTADAGHFLQALELELEQGPVQQQVETRLQELYRECRAALDDAQLGFEPLLPDMERPLSERADAVVEWCRGFLGGFGMAGAQRTHELSADGNEILRDFGTIAGSELACGNDEEDERALMEVNEFVRIGALLLHAEIAMRNASAGPAGNRLH